MHLSTASIVGAGALLLALVIALLRRGVVGPIEKLTAHAIAIGESNDLSARVDLERPDEIGALARAFDRMVERVAEGRQRMLEQSYQAGQAATAAGVLHNVRNMLSPLLYELDESYRRARALSAGTRLERAHAELDDPATPLDRRTTLERFVLLSNRRLLDETKGIASLLESMRHRVTRVEEVLTVQDESGRSVQALEPGDAPQRAVREVLPSDAAAWVLEWAGRSPAERRAEQNEVRLELPGGERWLELQMAPLDAPGVEEVCMGVGLDVTDRRVARERERFFAWHDPLTLVANRRLLEDRANHALARAKRRDLCLRVLHIEVDQFKAINDALGRAGGDRVLVAIARRLADSLREEDTVARLGGDEFVAILETSEDGRDCLAAIERLQALLQVPIDLDGREIPVSVSIGAATWPGDGENVAELFRCAELAATSVKAGGGGGWRLYDPSMQSDAVDLVAFRAAFGAAIAHGGLVLHYQPQVDAISGHLVGLEALVRWERPGIGLVPPGAFIPAAEHTGLVVQMGEWVVREACRQVRAWTDAGLRVPRVAVNVSARQIVRHDLVAVFRDALCEYGVPRHALEAEVTESLPLSSPERARRLLENLRELGVDVALDDFGSGFSSLAHLRRLPIDRVKLDQGFVTDLLVSAEAQGVARSVAGMAHALGMEIIAEGVERAEEAALLADFGYDVLQGYFFGRPAPAAEVEVRLSRAGAERDAARGPAMRRAG